VVESVPVTILMLPALVDFSVSKYMCCPVSVPHRLATPGMVVLGLVIVSSSFAVPQSPVVLGPARTAVSKSNLIWQTFVVPVISYPHVFEAVVYAVG
jgi:hypothetical protein